MTPTGDPLGALEAIVRRRHMVRNFCPNPVEERLLERLLDLTRRAPSAGNTQPWELLVLRGPGVGRYWKTTLREPSTFRWQGLLAAPVLVIPYVRPGAYADRYAEPDKAATGLGAGVDAWSTPYWWIDGGAAVQNLLLAATAAGLGACLFGQFEHEQAVREVFGVPDDRRALGTVAIGHPASTDEPGRSATRTRPDLATVVHHDRW